MGKGDIFAFLFDSCATNQPKRMTDLLPSKHNTQSHKYRHTMTGLVRVVSIRVCVARLQMEEFNYVSVLGRGHFGKVGVHSSRVLIRFMWMLASGL